MSDAPPSVGWRSWRMLLVAAGAGMVFYLDRQSIAILKSTISDALSLTNTDFALFDHRLHWCPTRRSIFSPDA